MRSIALITILLFSTAVFSDDADLLAKFAGTFEGSLFNGSDMDPVITSFSLNDKGELSGKYAMGEEKSIELGTLEDIHIESAYSISMTWKDKYGEGTLRILFSEDYQVFWGFWGDSETPAAITWNGLRK